jgi:hypothetical protein
MRSNLKVCQRQNSDGAEIENTKRNMIKDCRNKAEIGAGWASSIK